MFRNNDRSSFDTVKHQTKYKCIVLDERVSKARLSALEWTPVYRTEVSRFLRLM